MIVRPKPFCRPLAPTRTHVAEVDSRKDPEAVAVRARLDRLDAVAKAVTGKVVGSDVDLDVQRVEFGDHVVEDTGVGKRPSVTMNVHHRKFGARDQVFIGDELGFGPVVHNARRRQLRCPAALRAHFGHALRAGLARLDLYTTTTSLGGRFDRRHERYR